MATAFPSLVNALTSHNYTGNVRELTNLLWRSIESSSGDTLECTGTVRTQLKNRLLRDTKNFATSGQPNRLISSEDLRAALVCHRGVKERI